MSSQNRSTAFSASVGKQRCSIFMIVEDTGVGTMMLAARRLAGLHTGEGLLNQLASAANQDGRMRKCFLPIMILLYTAKCCVNKPTAKWELHIRRRHDAIASWAENIAMSYLKTLLPVGMQYPRTDFSVWQDRNW